MDGKAQIVALVRVREAQSKPFVPVSLHDGDMAAVVYESDGSFYVRDSRTGRVNEKRYSGAAEAAEDLASRWLAQKARG